MIAGSGQDLHFTLDVYLHPGASVVVLVASVLQSHGNCVTGQVPAGCVRPVMH